MKTQKLAWIVMLGIVLPITVWVGYWGYPGDGSVIPPLKPYNLKVYRLEGEPVQMGYWTVVEQLTPFGWAFNLDMHDNDPEWQRAYEEAQKRNQELAEKVEKIQMNHATVTSKMRGARR